MKDHTPIIHTEGCGKIAAWYPTDKIQPGAAIVAGLFTLPDGTHPKKCQARTCQHCGGAISKRELRHAMDAVKKDRVG